MSNNPYQPQTQSPGVNPNFDQPKKSGGGGCLKIALIVLGVGILCCGCCGGGIYWMMGKGMKQLASSVETQYANHPVVQDKLGGIDSCTFSWGGLISYAQENPNAEKGTIVFEVSGPKGSGQIIARQDPSNQQQVMDAKLIMNGEEFELD